MRAFHPETSGAPAPGATTPKITPARSAAASAATRRRPNGPSEQSGASRRAIHASIAAISIVERLSRIGQRPVPSTRTNHGRSFAISGAKIAPV
jgi:hypothetical protein